MLARVHNRRPQGAETFRPQKSSIAGVRLRSVLRVREDGSRTGSAILWLKSDGSSPTLTELAHTNPTIHAFRDRVHNRISRKLPTRTPLTYKIPNASPKGMHRTSNTKTSPTKTDETKAEIQQTSNYTKHNCKRQGTKAAQQRPTQTP